MAPEMRGGVFFQLPLGHAAGRADPFEPFVTQPSCRPAVSGVVDHEGFIAVGGNAGLVTRDFDGLDAVQQPFARRPDLDLVDQPEQRHPFAIEASLGRLDSGWAITPVEAPSQSA